MTAQHYRHFALYFENGDLIQEITEEYASAEDMLIVIEQWLAQFRTLCTKIRSGRFSWCSMRSR